MSGADAGMSRRLLDATKPITSSKPIKQYFGHERKDSKLLLNEKWNAAAFPILHERCINIKGLENHYCALTWSLKTKKLQEFLKVD